MERVMATNHLGPHLLTTSLIPILVPNGTVVTISSDSNLHAASMEDLNSEKEYRAQTIYARRRKVIKDLLFLTSVNDTCVSHILSSKMFHRLRSKLANILMTRELEARESGELEFHLNDILF